MLPSRRITKGPELNLYEILNNAHKIHVPPSTHSTAIIKSQGVFLILEAARDAQISTHEVKLVHISTGSDLRMGSMR